MNRRADSGDSMATRASALARTLKLTLATTALIGVGSAVASSRRIALEHDRKRPNQIADYYEGRSTSSLLSSLFVYTISSSPILVALGKASIAACDSVRAPFIYEAVARHTFFAQFCGGESFFQVQDTVRALREDNIGVILNYAKEEHGTGEAAFEQVLQDTYKSIEIAGTLPNNFIAVKLSALADPRAIKARTDVLRSGAGAANVLGASDQIQIDNLRRRVRLILDYGVEKKVRVLIDAEQDRYQGAIDEITLDLYRTYNRKEAFAYGTYQCYLKRAIGSLERDLALAREEGWVLGVKLVRGAYIASEPRHLIHDTKDDTDAAYNTAIKLLLPSPGVETVIATHNSESLDVALSLYPTRSPVCFSQLYGMSAPLTHALKSTLAAMPQSAATRQGGGIRVYSYLPWGTVEETMKYLLRRADENSAMVDRGKAERNEILGELSRRMLERLILW